MKKLIIKILLIISLNTHAEWKFHNSSSQGDSFYIHMSSITHDEKYVNFWYLKSYLIPNKFGDFSAVVNVKGDCVSLKLKYLVHVWYPEPMGKGLGQQSNSESEWESPTTDSVGIDLLSVACNHKL